MERCFIVTKDSELYKDLIEYRSLVEEQRRFIENFFTEYGIESDLFLIRGDGLINVPFEKRSKSTIKLRIKPTANDLERFGSMLSKPNEQGLCSFKKNLKIAKDFAQRCIDEKVVINVYRPRISTYFKSIGLYGCNLSYIELEDKFYLRVNSDALNKDETPCGFVEIPKSEYYKVEEKLREKSKGIY